MRLIILTLLLSAIGAAQTNFPMTLRDAQGNVIFQVNELGEVTATKFTSSNPNNPKVGSITLCQADNSSCQVFMVGPEPGLYIVPEGETLSPMHKVMTRQEFDDRMKEWFTNFKVQP